VSLTPRLLNPRETVSLTHRTVGQVGHTTGINESKETKLLPLTRLERLSLGRKICG
jgi:hypothetical protein